MFSHVHLGTNDYPATFAFYASLMRQLGLLQHFAQPSKQWAAWRKPGTSRPLFIIGQPFNGNPADVGNGQMTAFLAPSHETVDRCHALALELGGTDAGAPGLRSHYHAYYYGCYFLDPAGNKICVVCHDPAGGYDVRQDDLASEQPRTLVVLHLAGMHENSPPGSVFALDLSGLIAPNVRVFTAWDGVQIAGMVALKSLDDGTAEVKSMRTHPDYLRKGVGRRLLAHLLAEALAHGTKRLSLETGSGPAFEPALALYRRHGFVNGGSFDKYEQSAFNQFLHLDL